MKTIITLLTCICMTLLVSTGCSSNTQKENMTLGSVTGAIIGGLTGSLIGQGTGRLVAVGVGAIAGGIIGGEIGSSMDRSDCVVMNRALDGTTYKSTTWRNQKTGSRYTVTPTSKVSSIKGNSYCRNYETTAVINNKTQTIQGTACRQVDGSWKTIS